MRRILFNPVCWCVVLAFVAPVNVLKASGNGPGKGHKHVEHVVSAKASAKAAAKDSRSQESGNLSRLRETNNDGPSAKTPVASFAEEAAALYEEINLQEIGLTKKAFEYALRGYYYMLEHHWLNKTNILSICDLSQSSRNKRLYVLDLEQKTVLVNTYVAHGRNSGMEYAQSFSNNPSSHKTSLGFYVTQDTYYGSNGLSLKIRGMERGFNDRAGGRNIVVHGSEYVGPDFLQMNGFSGRSYGCPAVPADESEEIIDLIKDGSCLFIYHPTRRYISRSKILNG